ncbi:MAG: hypothetical protein IPP99_08780 [Chitinophagaceae bacterium]|nr:hypothetical protein [Chitinophagaceae bacterium]
MRRLALIIITLSVLYFVGGFFAVKFKRLDKDIFNESATIIGGVASILGLLGFVLPGIKNTDLKNIELDNLKKLAETAEEIQKRELELNAKQSDIKSLELQKKEMEFLIRKASLSLYLKDQLESYNKRLEEIVADNNELSKVIEKISDLTNKSAELEIEISNSPLADKAFELISTLKKKHDLEIEISSPLNLISSITNAFAKFISSYIRQLK